jgi:hypothetical protein
VYSFLLHNPHIGIKYIDLIFSVMSFTGKTGFFVRCRGDLWSGTWGSAAFSVIKAELLIVCGSDDSEKMQVAEKLLKDVVKEVNGLGLAPTCARALMGLAKIYLVQQRFLELNNTLSYLEQVYWKLCKESVKSKPKLLEIVKEFIESNKVY